MDGLVGGTFGRRILQVGEDASLAHFTLSLFPVEHDAAQPAGVRIKNGNAALGYLTDTGRVTPSIFAGLEGCTQLLVESNYDPDMLRHGTYPQPLKRRISGGRGHLSNDACGALLRQVITPRTERVVLHHLSRYNNTPELALATNHAILHRARVQAPDMLAAPPDGPFGPFAW